MKKILALALLVSMNSSCESQQLKKLKEKAKTTAKTLKVPEKPLSNEEVVSGLREALTIGTNNSSALASKVDGYYKNPALFIPFPPEAEKVKGWAEKFGMKPQVDKFETTLNRAAEEAAKDAAPVFVNAIKGMSIGDGFAILKGEDNAATKYLTDKTTAELKEKFTPIVQTAIDKVEPILTAI